MSSMDGTNASGDYSSGAAPEGPFARLHEVAFRNENELLNYTEEVKICVFLRMM
jgi:hypothetical protein